MEITLEVWNQILEWNKFEPQQITLFRWWNSLEKLSKNHLQQRKPLHKIAILQCGNCFRKFQDKTLSIGMVNILQKLSTIQVDPLEYMQWTNKGFDSNKTESIWTILTSFCYQSLMISYLVSTHLFIGIATAYTFYLKILYPWFTYLSFMIQFGK